MTQIPPRILQVFWNAIQQHYIMQWSWLMMFCDMQRNVVRRAMSKCPVVVCVWSVIVFRGRMHSETAAIPVAVLPASYHLQTRSWPLQFTSCPELLTFGSAWERREVIGSMPVVCDLAFCFISRFLAGWTPRQSCAPSYQTTNEIHTALVVAVIAYSLVVKEYRRCNVDWWDGIFAKGLRELDFDPVHFHSRVEIFISVEFSNQIPVPSNENWRIS